MTLEQQLQPSNVEEGLKRGGGRKEEREVGKRWQMRGKWKGRKDKKNGRGGWWKGKKDEGE